MKRAILKKKKIYDEEIEVRKLVLKCFPTMISTSQSFKFYATMRKRTNSSTH